MVLEISKAVIFQDDKYLLLKRAPHSKSFPNLWDFPGGKHNPEETPEQAVIRETKEETSLSIKPGNKIKDHTYKNEKYNILFHYLVPTEIFGELQLSPDHTEYCWITKIDMENLDLHPSVRLFFK